MTNSQTPPAIDAPASRETLARQRGRGLRSVQSVLLVLAALVGIVVLLGALAPLVGLQPVRLATGSMAPTYPAGSVVLVRDIPAEEVRVGDVATVVRTGAVPVTHRVNAVEVIPGGARLMMQGDANETPDPTPYAVARVGLVVAGVPLLGYAFAATENPAFGPVAAVLVALIVLWAWWPPRHTPAHRMAVPAPAHERSTP